MNPCLRTPSSVTLGLVLGDGGARQRRAEYLAVKDPGESNDIRNSLYRQYTQKLRMNVL